MNVVIHARTHTHIYACIYIFSLDTMCARQEYTLLIVGGCERKRGRGREKKRERKDVETMEKGGKETASIKKYKEPDWAKNFSPSHILHVENCASLIKFSYASFSRKLSK